MKTRFDLEQEILACWNITDDLDRLLSQCEMIEPAETADYIQNIVLGLKSVYAMRFQETWDTFEYLVGVKDGNI